MNVNACDLFSKLKRNYTLDLDLSKYKYMIIMSTLVENLIVENTWFNVIVDFNLEIIRKAN